MPPDPPEAEEGFGEKEKQAASPGPMRKDPREGTISHQIASEAECALRVLQRSRGWERYSLRFPEDFNASKHCVREFLRGRNTSKGHVAISSWITMFWNRRGESLRDYIVSQLDSGIAAF